jgi:hypothetical protein
MPRFDWASSLVRGQWRVYREIEAAAPDVGVLLTHADHHALVTGTADDRARQLERQ